LSSDVISQIIYVPDNHSTIQAAIDAAADGDTILVEESTCFENIDLEDYPMGLGGGIFIHGSGGKIIHNIIENNVMGTSTDYTTLPLIYNGGGIYADVFNNHTLIVRENMIRNNQCIGDDGNGAGAFLAGGRIIFDKNSVMDNRLEMMGAPMGAGLFWQFIEYKGNIDEYLLRTILLPGISWKEWAEACFSIMLVLLSAPIQLLIMKLQKTGIVFPYTRRCCGTSCCFTIILSGRLWIMGNLISIYGVT
jgi:hypothetical protein